MLSRYWSQNQCFILSKIYTTPCEKSTELDKIGWEHSFYAQKLCGWTTNTLNKGLWTLATPHGVTVPHWGRLTFICVSKLTIIGSDNGLSPGRRQAIILTNAGILLIGPLGTNVNDTSIEIHTFSFKKIHLKLSSGKCRPFCHGLNVLSYVASAFPGWMGLP